VEPEQVFPLPSAPHRPSVVELVGTGGAGVGVAVGVREGVGVGVGVVVGLVDEELGIGTTTEEVLGTGAGTEEDPGGKEPHVPKALWHPVPQYRAPLPQK
jgi:hypothetical protein